MDESLIKVRHERSKKDFPELTLRDDEYVEFALTRSKACLMMIFGLTALAVIGVLLAFVIVLLTQPTMDAMGKNFMMIILAVLLATAVIACLFAVITYKGNKLFITNKRVIQKVMQSPLAHSINIIDLASVEDASFHKKGLLAMIFHYGTLRLATVGDETSYTFEYSDISREDLEAVTKLIMAAKKERKNKEDKN